MDAARSAHPDPRAALLELYDPALPRVYGYLLRRCGQREVAEELTSETFLAAADAVRRTPPPTALDVRWLIGVARHKLADHWRRQAREERGLRLVAAEAADGTEDPWETRLDALRAEQTLAALAPQHRLALTLRYVDDLPVPEVADLLGRTLHATEALLVRARTAFRAQYSADEEVSGDA
jgi:RNA polymerase sigma-70 factor (ECF subfamily)